MKGTKATLCLVSLCCFALVIAAGPANGQTETSKSGANKSVSLTGCLQSGTDPDTFTLTNVTPSKGAKGSETYRLTAASGVDLKAHVGHKVLITGMMEPSKSGTELARTEPGAPSMGARVEVKSVKEVSASCP